MTPVDRAAIDATIDGMYARLSERMAPLGDRFTTLSSAMQRAGSGGKRFRPILVVRAFTAAGGDSDECEALLPVAAAFEILHTAFLMHDDVIDHDTERRGSPNVSGEFRDRAMRGGADAAGAAALGDAAGILAGDLLLLEAQRLIASAEVPTPIRTRLLDLLADAVLISAAGELADVEHTVLAEAPDLDETLSATHDKTAVYSFTAPLRAGALLAGAGTDIDQALERAGSRLGIAFQLVDDLIGAFGSRSQAGRESGSDLVAARGTPLIAVARDTGSWPVVHDALALAHTGPIGVRAAQRALDASGARDRLVRLVRDNLAHARSPSALPPDLARLIDDLARDVEDRIP